MELELCATQLGVTGWVQNTPSGTVVGEAHGSAAKLEQLSRWLQTVGSPKSRIDRADIAMLDACPKAPSAFTVKK